MYLVYFLSLFVFINFVAEKEMEEKVEAHLNSWKFIFSDYVFSSVKRLFVMFIEAAVLNGDSFLILLLPSFSVGF